MKHIAIYTRVSTELQTTDSQNHAIKEWLVKNPPELPVRYYEDLGISGSKSQRPALDQMLRDCRAGLIDTVMVYKLDRLSRVTTTSLKMTLEFDELGVDFVSVTQPVFSQKSFRYVSIALFAEMSQNEREALLERQKSGIAAAKARGVHCGRSRSISDETIQAMRRLRVQKKTYKQIGLELGYSTQTVHKYARF